MERMKQPNHKNKYHTYAIQHTSIFFFSSTTSSRLILLFSIYTITKRVEKGERGMKSREKGSGSDDGDANSSGRAMHQWRRKYSGGLAVGQLGGEENKTG